MCCRVQFAWRKACASSVAPAAHGAPSPDFVHAGALFGDFLPALSRSRRGSAEVWAFDPNSKALDLSNFGSRSRGLGSPEDSRAGSPLMIAFRGLREEPRAAHVGTRVSDCTPASATLGRWSATCVPLAPRDRGVDIKNAARTRHDIVGFGSIARGRFDVSAYANSKAIARARL